MKKYNPRHNKGFTLVELIVVIGILLILSSIAVVSFGNIMENARNAARHADAARLASALNQFNALAATPEDRVVHRLFLGAEAAVPGRAIYARDLPGAGATWVVGEAPFWSGRTFSGGSVVANFVHGSVTTGTGANAVTRNTGIMDFEVTVTMDARNFFGIVRNDVNVVGPHIAFQNDVWIVCDCTSAAAGSICAPIISNDRALR